MRVLLLALLGTALGHLLALSALLRRGPVLGSVRLPEAALGTAWASAFCLLLALGLASLTQSGLRAVAIELPATAALLLTLGPAVLATAGLLHRVPGLLLQRLPQWLGLIAGSAAVIGLALQHGFPQGELLAVLGRGLAAALGFGLLLFMLIAQQQRLAVSAVPTRLRGTPILLLGVAVLALALWTASGGGA